jgi:hypothetical protein
MLEIGFSSGGLIVTYRCSAACRHCLYKSSPKRDDSYMSPDLLRDMLRKAVSLGCRSFHIGGGEPFLDFHGLLRVLQVMRDEGVGVDYLETNAGWFVDVSSARDKLGQLFELGCTTVMVSVCPFHVEFVPLAQVEGVVGACVDVGMGYFVWQDQYYAELATLDRSTVHSHSELRRVFGEGYVASAAGRYGLTMNGRALQSFAPRMKHHPVETLLAKNPSGCRELRHTGHAHLDLYGNYVPPGCVGFSLHYTDLGRELDDADYPIFAIAAREGISGLLRYARESADFVSDPAGYVSKCHLCGHIREHLVSSRRTATDESLLSTGLGPAEYYALR